MNRSHPLEKLRNFGIIAHIDAGKTTVSERLLFYTGVSHKIGEVHEGDTVMDWMPQERERGITITAAAITMQWKGIQMNLIDTPGHIDFTAEVQRSLRVLDGAVVVFDGVAGVEPQSETVWRQADKYGTPRICFINKLDRMGGSFEKSYQSILDKLTKNAVAMTIPIGEEEHLSAVIDLLKMKAIYFEGEKGEIVVEKEIPADMVGKAKAWREKMVDRIAGEDDALTNKLLGGEEISNEELMAAMRKACLAFKLVPVFCGSALKNKGTQFILDAVIDYLPSPLDIGFVKGTDPKTGAEIERKFSDTEPFAALVFKVATDPFVGQLTFFRVYSGVLNKGTYLLNSVTGEQERIARILRMKSNSREELDVIYAGEIGATVGLKNTITGHTLCDKENPVVLEKISFPEPVISMRVEPKTKADQEKLIMSIRKLTQEDPTFRIKEDIETGETIISGMGELHLDIIQDRLRREFNVDANFGKPQVAYRETITAESEAEEKYVRQSGGKGQYGHVRLRLKPLERGTGFQFVDEIKGGAIPKEFIKPTEKGVIEALDKGIIAGYPMVDVEVTLYDGSFHEVDSSEFAFKIAGSMAVQAGAKKAKPVILEPIMKTEVITPDAFFGTVISDLSSRRGKIEETKERMGMKVLDAMVPLSEMFGYATALRSLTEGRASFTMEFNKYEIVPNNVAQQIMEGKVK
ncbi:MAG: translation elongation factor G [Candidatus Staskawiczbacteria bacterium RIFCSPLOWO2_01_FULL_40_39]|uniref:Elongation factor G n=1 Tax=Candidatus Staskawiczbacteria bacterium RIFCSPHIGHO2_01_FULL_39_25 TaxID=1802202 RepID=A0A1G2HQY2_9BACT|nr:MAG: translation elongation factor G [Candidatus Staskawiczbacteria bacterium RIFCSPHIGHO2_01_FULL_39_25]OGZ72648.1 MAG: translation elongation factor G [Candidatus Staskawiczbacteria bacterium RIFCSPLOWO2_01_FULL_40_39]